VADPKNVVVKTYWGSQAAATAAFQRDAAKMAAEGYFPTSQVWLPGSYGCGAFLVALLLCIILIGILVFIYMLVVKPEGRLTVTYEYRPPVAAFVPEAEKTCPRCAEQVKAAATVCRFCGHEFNSDAPNSEATNQLPSD
jgi:hypothetical protein